MLSAMTMLQICSGSRVRSTLASCKPWIPSSTTMQAQAMARTRTTQGHPSREAMQVRSSPTTSSRQNRASCTATRASAGTNMDECCIWRYRSMVISNRANKLIMQAKTPKGRKLLELRDKLARLNGQPFLSQEKQRLYEVNQQNLLIESEIFRIFNSISEYFVKTEERVASITREIVDSTRAVERAILRELNSLKEQQFQAVKEDVDNYIKYKRRTKKLLEEVEAAKVTNMHLTHSVSKLKPFSAGPLQAKIQHCQLKIAVIDTRIDKFNTVLEHIPRPNAAVSQEGTLNEGIKAQDQSYPWQEQQLAKPAELKLLNYFTEATREEQRNPSDASEKEENLIDNLSGCEEPFQASPQASKQRPSEVRNAGKEQRGIKISRKQSQPMMAGHSRDILNEIAELRKSRQTPIEVDLSARKPRFELAIADQISRVRSEQNLFIRRTLNAPENAEVLYSRPKGATLENLSCLTTVSANPNKLRDSKMSARSGSWAKILKDQQARYNEVRSKIKG